jgi:hypothetical protein
MCRRVCVTTMGIWNWNLQEAVRPLNKRTLDYSPLFQMLSTLVIEELDFCIWPMYCRMFYIFLFILLREIYISFYGYVHAGQHIEGQPEL